MGIFTKDYILMFYTGLFLVFLRIDYSVPDYEVSMTLCLEPGIERWGSDAAAERIPAFPKYKISRGSGKGNESQRPFQDVAWLKPATQIGTYQNNVAAYGPQWATDGLTGDTDPYSFVDSGDDNMPAWWKVDLQSDCIIKAVGYLMWNREGRNRYLETVMASIETTDGSQVVCGTYDSTGKNVTYLFMSCNSFPPATGRRVIISRNGGYQPRYMAATEFYVHGIFLFGNQALDKPTNQSYKEFTSPPSDSTLAVDKNFLSCSQTRAPAEEMPWWQVDLQMYISVSSVRVFVSDTNKYTSYFQDIEITVDNTSTLTSQNICTRYSKPSNNGPINVTLPCSDDITGRFVTFRRKPSNSSTNKLALCDIQVMGRFISELTTANQPVTYPQFSLSSSSSTTSPYTNTNSPTSTTSITTSSTTTSPTSTTTFYSSTSSSASTASSFPTVNSPTSATSSTSTTSSPSSPRITESIYITTSSATTTTSNSYYQNYSSQRTSPDVINPVTINYTTEATTQQPASQGLQTGYIILIIVLAAVAVVSLIVVAFFIGRSKACRKRAKPENRETHNQSVNKNKEFELTSYYSKIKDEDIESRQPPTLPDQSLNLNAQSNAESRPQPPLPCASLVGQAQSNVTSRVKAPLPYESLVQPTQSNIESKPKYPLPYASLIPQIKINENTNVSPDNMYGSHGYVEMRCDSSIKSYSALSQPVKENGHANKKLHNMSRDTIYASVGQNSASSYQLYGSSGIGSDLDPSDLGFDSESGPLS